MYSVYILRSVLNRKHYIGYTADITRRLDEHNKGQNTSTRNKGKWLLLHKEDYNSKEEAHRREQQIKSYKGGNAFKKLIAAVVHR